MFKRLLAFTLAGCLVFDAAPVTSYAAGLRTETALESSAQTEGLTAVLDGDADPAPEEGVLTENTSMDGEEPSADETVTGEPGGYNAPAGSDVSSGDALLPLTKQADGSYLLEAAEYKLSVKAEEGFGHIRLNVSMEAAEGQTLATSYSLRVDYRTDDGDVSGGTTMYLSTGNRYEQQRVMTVSPERNYRISLELRDAGGSTLAKTEDIALQTKKLGVGVAVYNTKATEDSITLDVETLNTGRCYYAPADAPGEEQCRGISYGWNEQTFEGLQPGTEYYFQFTDDDGVELLKTTASTAASTETTKVEYSAVPGAAGTDFGFTLQADVSGYGGEAVRAYFYYSYVDALGIKRTEATSILINEVDGNTVTQAADGTKSFSLSEAIDGHWEALEAQTEYPVTMWVKLGSKTFPAETKTVKTPDAAYNAEEVSFTLTADEESAETVHYTVTRPARIVDGEEKGRAYLNYRPAGSKADYDKQISYSPSDSGTISGLQSGVEYEFVLFAGGVKKAQTYTWPGDKKLSFVGEAQVNAFDLVRTCKAEATTGTYYLRLSCWSDDTQSYQSIGNAVSLDAENAYQAEFKTASAKKLEPDTDYDLKWTLSTSTSTYGSAVCTRYETIHTPKAVVTLEDAGSGYTSQKYKVTLAQADIASFAESQYIFGSIPVYTYIRKAGDAAYRYRDSVSLSIYEGCSGTIAFKGLEPSTDYEISLRDGASYSGSKEYVAATFTTSADERAVTVTGIETDFHNARVDYELSGIPSAMEGYDNYVLCYIREGAEGDWEKADFRSYNATYGHTGRFYISQYNGADLKDNTTYEYRIGLGGYNTAVSALAKTLSGTFSTQEDKRSLSGAGVSAGYTVADASVLFSGNSEFIGSYIYFFYKEAAASDWTDKVRQYAYDSSANLSYELRGLKADTEYDYAFVISDSYNCSSPDEVTKDSMKATGTFATRKAAYTLQFAADEGKSAYNKAVVAVTAKDGADDDRIEVVLTLSDGQERAVILKRSQGYQQNVTFAGLLGSKEYTITKAVLGVTEKGEPVTIAELACDYKFTTKAAEAPTAISLSQDKIALNAANTNGRMIEGYNRKTLKATAQPQTAAADFIWESSNPEVAIVSGGVVYAQGVGEAKITVSSAYDKTVTATCDVTVKNYVIGYVAQAGAEPQPWYYTSSGSVYKGGYVEGLGLYEQSGTSTLTPVSDFEVTTDRAGIVAWDSETGRLNALSSGTVRLSMAKGGVKASFSLTVTASGKGFGITGFTTNNTSYPAVAGAEADSYILAYTPGITYKAVGEISPAQLQAFDPSEFTWSISDTSVATVSDSGVITPQKAGEVTLTVTPTTFHSLQNVPYAQDKVEIALQIRNLPAQTAGAIYVLANTAGKIGDVSFPADWGEGWTWKYPATPLVTNGVYSNSSYRFEAVCSAPGNYPCEKTVSVYIGRITGMSVRDVSGHNLVLEVPEAGASADKLSLAVSTFSQGALSAETYEVEIPAVDGLTITKNAQTGYYDVTAQKAGSYTLSPVIKAKDTGAVLANTSCKLKAVDGKQAASITFKLDDDSVTAGLAIKNGTIVFNTVEDKKDFAVTATVKDRSGQELDTVLQWKTTDKSVAAVTASKQDSHTANVAVKGEGHTVLTATAKDAQGLSATLKLEVQNHRPRVDTAKATVNIAYNYDDYFGKSLAAAAGSVELVPVYGESIKSVIICDESGQTRTDLRADSYSGKYLIVPASAQLQTGNYNCKLLVKTSADVEYSYNLKVSVIDKAPSVSAKMGTAPNLFFTDTTGSINLTIAGNNRVDTVTWEDQSDGVNNGFAMMPGSYWSKNKYVSYIAVSQQPNLRLERGKLTDTGVEKGTLRVTVRGYKKEYTFENFKIKYNYKKPALETKASSSSVAPSAGQNRGDFYWYDKTNKRTLYYDESPDNNRYYDELTWDNEEDVALILENYSAWVDYVYSGKEGSKKITMTLDSPYWREPLKAVHTIKAVKPQAYLRYSQLTYNTAVKSTASNWIYLKNNSYSIGYTDVVIEGANPASKKLLDNDLFIIKASGNRITVEQSDAKLMGDTIPAGSYSYKVTPYYENPGTGEKTALNTMTLKLKVVNKPVTAKVSPKGALDLTYGAGSTPTDKKNVAVLVDPKFSNMADGYSVDGWNLTGEYSDCFSLNYGRILYGGKWADHYYITIRDTSPRKLKAGQAYKLAIEYTLRTGNGETFTVISNTFTVKPKQTAAKVTVSGNNQTLYAGSTLTRTCYLSAPSYYSISSAYGSLDCNKDGKADIVVSGGSTLTVRISDADAVGASASGKSYTVPVTVQLKGRDGVSKDVKISVKVKVKR